MTPSAFAPTEPGHKKFTLRFADVIRVRSTLNYLFSIQANQVTLLHTVRAMKRVDPFKLRKRLGLNQSEFWGRLEVTQSGGSRYENGRRMPPPVRKLLGIVYLKERP